MAFALCRLFGVTRRQNRVVFNSMIGLHRSSVTRSREINEQLMSERKAFPTHPLRWFPEFLEFGTRQFRSHGRVLGASIVVGFVAGLGGIAFSIVGQWVLQIGLEGVIGLPAAGPVGETRFEWIPVFGD